MSIESTILRTAGSATIYAVSMKSVRPVRVPLALGIHFVMDKTLIHPMIPRTADSAGLPAQQGNPVATAVV